MPSARGTDARGTRGSASPSRGRGRSSSHGSTRAGRASAWAWWGASEALGARRAFAAFHVLATLLGLAGLAYLSLRAHPTLVCTATPMGVVACVDASRVQVLP